MGNETRVETLARGLTLLRCFEEERIELSLKDLARLSGLAKPTAMRMLRTLERSGFVSRYGDVYRIGPQCLKLGGLYRFDEDLQYRAAPIMQRLSEQVNEVVQLGTVAEGEILYLERCQPNRSVMISPVVTRPGSTRPLYTTALGKAILASQEEQKTSSYLNSVELVANTPSTITSPEGLREELELTRNRGYAVDNCETDPEVRCVGATIFSDPDRLAAALSISAPEFRLSAGVLDEFGTLVREAAVEISTRYG
ncbi:MAG: IclR family transcriptional regulator [Rubrobacteraceae bacterium]